MSQPVAYTPPDYVAPELLDQRWGGDERRSKDPVDILSRSLNKLCLEASDPYEIVAHLEALGYNSATALERLGVSNHFELAQQLYHRTPKVRSRAAPKARVPPDWATPMAMVLSFVVTFLLGAIDRNLVLAPALVVLVWSQVGAALLARARGTLDTAGQAGVLAFLLQAGLVTVAATWPLERFGIGSVAPMFIWFGVAGLLWAERALLALILPLLVGFVLLVESVFSLPPLVTNVCAVCVPLALVAPFAWRGAWSGAKWVGANLDAAFSPFLYGLGQGLLIFALLARRPEIRDLLPGIGLLLVILLLSQPLLVSYKRRVTQKLWDTSDPRRYLGYARWQLVAYVAVYLLPSAAALLFELTRGPQPWTPYWHAFALFGLCLGLAVVAFTIGRPAVPAITFVLAGAFALLGAPFVLSCGVLALAQLLLLMLELRLVGRYAVYLV